MFKSFRYLFFVFVITTSLVFGNVTPAQAASLPAEINKQFTPLQIDAGGVSVMRVTIFNPNTFGLTNASWTDNLVGVQPGLYIANPAGVVNTCGIVGDVTAVPGTTTLALSNGTVPPQVGPTPGECYVEVNVSSVTAGNLINTVPAGNLSSQGDDAGTIVNITNTTPASATITVIAVTPPSLTKGFAPNTIFVGNFSRLTITLNNNDNATNLTGTSYTDTLPTGLVLRNPVNATVTGCGVGYSLTATPGGNQIAISNATVTPSTNCVVAVDVTGASGLYTSANGNPNTIPAGPGGPGSIQTNQGVTNGSPASADLTIQPVDIDKAFSPANFQAGDTTTLTITLSNPTGTPYTGIDISDTLPGAFVVNNFVSNTCGGTLTAIPGTNLITLDNGTIPASATPPTPATCVITVVVTSPVASSGTNTIPANNLSSPDHPGLTNITAASANITAYAVGTGLSGTKSFSPSTIDPGQNTRLRIDLTAPADTNLTNFSITDNLPPGVTITNSTPASKSANCIGGTLSAPTGGTIISWTGGTINAGQLCRIEVFVTSNTPGTVTNTITPANISNDQNRDPAADITANLTVRQPSDLSASKAFYPTQVIANGISTLTITLQNTNASPLINVSASDNLNTMGSGTNTVRIASAPNYSASTTCGGTLSAVAATQLISLTGGTIPAQVSGVPGICTITVNVQAGTNTSTRTNTIPRLNVSGTIQGLGTIINPASDATATLQVLPLTIGVVKGFDPVLVYGAATSTMTVELTNPNNATLVGIAFTDNMALLASGIVLANPVNFNTGTCGGTLTGNPGDSSFSFSGGTLLPNSSCELTLSVVMQVNGNRTNRIPAGAVTTLNGVSSPDPTEASLTNLPGLSINKVFNPDTILVGQPTTLTLTIENTSAIPVVNMGVTDILPGALPFGLVIASPTNASTTCVDTDGTGGYSFTATAGTQQISLVGAEMGGSSSCVIVVDVTSDEPGVYINTIAAGAINADGGITNNNPTSDTLTVNALANNNGLTKTIVSTNETFTTGNDVAIGEIVTYEITIDLPIGVALTNVTVTDQMDKGLAFVDCLSVVLGGVIIANPVCTPPAPAVSSITDSGDLITNPANPGRQVVFTIGDIAAPATATTLVIQYRAIVLDVIENQDGIDLNNNVTWAWTGGSFSTSAPTVNIVEPDLAIDKNATPTSNVAIGAPIQFTLVIDHTTPQSQTDAFDVVVSDILPANLAYVECTVQYSAGLAPDTLASTYCNPGSTTTNLIFEWAVFPLGQTSTITFFATLIGSPAVNVASVAWTSIPIDPQQNGLPFQLSTHNTESTERWYDPLDDVNIYSVSDSVSINSPTSSGGDNSGVGLPTTLPVTGFAPNKITSVPQQPSNKAYTATDVWLEIPSLGVKIPIVGVPLIDEDWDVSWLWQQAGWLEGTAFPGWLGNSALTSHVSLPNGEEGPFAKLNHLAWGDKIIVHAYGSKYIYEVRKNSTISPYNMTVLGHEEDAWLTLVTCKNYDEAKDSYTNRIAVRAILIEIKEDSLEFRPGSIR